MMKYQKIICSIFVFLPACLQAEEAQKKPLKHEHYWVSNDADIEVEYKQRKLPLVKPLDRLVEKSKKSLPVLKIHNGIRQ